MRYGVWHGLAAVTRREVGAMVEYTIWAIKGARDEDGTPMAEVNAELRASLKDGVARFGWSYTPTADLTTLQQRITTQGWDSLSADEKDCYQAFLLNVQAGDWWVYINVPEVSRCCAAKVTGPYKWLGQYDDFNHSVSVDPSSFFEFDRRDAAVPPYLRARLMLQGKKWRINAQSDFENLVEAARSNRLGTSFSLSTDIGALAAELEPLLAQIAGLIQRAAPNRNLESLLEQVIHASSRSPRYATRWFGRSRCRSHH